MRASSLRSWESDQCRRLAQALEKAGLTLNDIDLVEVNEALLRSIWLSKRSWDSIATAPTSTAARSRLGHPLGATGTRLVLTVLHELHRREGRYGLATACIGGGQGIAMIVERVRA